MPEQVWTSHIALPAWLEGPCVTSVARAARSSDGAGGGLLACCNACGAGALATIGCWSTSGVAAETNCRQIDAGRLPPVTWCVGLLSSLPIQMPTINESLKPMNQASRYSWL